jgi:WD40 repeat protein
MAFNPSGTRLAAGSDNDLEILDIATGRVKTVSNARLLGWADDDHVYCLSSGGSLAIVGATASLPDWNGIVLYWAIDSTTGASLDVAATGNLLRILGADGKATLLDLGSSGLVVDRDLTFDTVSGQPRGSWLVPAQWSPDGRMIVLKSADSTSLALISVDPAG